MHAVVLTFPGHFFQTQLCVRHLVLHYPEVQRITCVLDDIECSPWISYVEDFTREIRTTWSGQLDIRAVSGMRTISDCVAGWWRQQLVKLTLDHWLDDDQWFVVDGDVIFHSRCDVWNRVPISRRGDHASRWSSMSVNYVSGVLGVSQGFLTDGASRVITNPVPFRHLDRSLLTALRQHVEARFHADFVDLHLRWFADQTIVADIDPPTRWVMTEWELIECYRRWILDLEWPLIEVGSGYPLDASILDKQGGQNLFYHSYQRDSEVAPAWFSSQGLDLDRDVWSRSQHWYNYRERSLRA